jgi:UDP-N-acetylmuramate--alanine ligase
MIAHAPAPADFLCHDGSVIDQVRADAAARVHFVGVGGTGMSGYADFRALSRAATSGSDRGFDQGMNAELRAGMVARGVHIFPQDGSGVAGAAALVVSAAIEAHVADVAAAIAAGIPIISRKDWLAAHYRAFQTVAITGTAGKSTVTAMVFEILRQADRDPSLMTGADLQSLVAMGGPGNTFVGTGPLVIEADESDKGIGDYTPQIGVILNLQRDHDEPANMLPAFRAFQAGCAHTCLLADHPTLLPLQGGARTVVFGESAPQPQYRVTDVRLEPDGSWFTFGGQAVRLPVPGRHNVDNAAAALAVATALGLSMSDAVQALGSYQGVARRFEVVGCPRGITVIDDYAHNPDKIAAVIRTAHARAKRLILMFQPTGFGPTRFLRNDLVAMLATECSPDDFVAFAPIPYAGGTAVKDISSNDLVADLHARGFMNAVALATRDDFMALARASARAGDAVIILGGRDPSLPKFARAVATALASD